MHLSREKFLLFFFLFLVTGAQIVSAQKTAWSKKPADEIGAETEIEKNEFRSQIFSARAGFENTAAESLKKEPVETSPAASLKTEIKDIKEVLREVSENSRPRFDLRAAEIRELKNLPYRKTVAPDDPVKSDENEKLPPTREGFNWRGAFSQSFMFLGVQHGYALVFQKKTRQALKGKFWSDYGRSVKSLSGWSDGNRFFTNYIAHPMQGALTGFIYVQNSPQARRQEFGKSGDYWRSRLKAMLWTTAWSTQFEIGPVSQASIGNVGLKGKQTWVDVVITPTVGSALMVAEDALDRYLIKSIERRTDNFYIKIFSRMLFNPVRIFANLLRLKEPWYRDRPTAQ